MSLKFESTQGGFQIKIPRLQAGGVELASHVSLSLPFGALTVLSGPNGSGKSTLINSLAANSECPVLVYRPAFGLRPGLGVREQAQALARFTAGDNPSLNIDNLLAQVDLLDWAGDSVAGLSSGQKARLGMIPLLTNKASLWLLDEPLNALDHESLEVLCKCCRLHLDSGGALLVVSHLGQSILQRNFASYPQFYHVLEAGKVSLNCSQFAASPQASAMPVRSSEYGSVGFSVFLTHEMTVLRASAGSLLWGAVFFWMVLSFFGLSLLKPEREVSFAVIWVSSILSVVLSVKDWFQGDFESGWLRLLSSLDSGIGRKYWLSKALVTWVALLAITLPVVLLSGAQLMLGLSEIIPLLLALAAGLFSAVPLLGLIALMVHLTRGGAVLVYILALPLLVPVMIFGLEASQAHLLGRSAAPALNVLFFAGLIGFLLGPWVAEKLISLILE